MMTMMRALLVWLTITFLVGVTDAFVMTTAQGRSPPTAASRLFSTFPHDPTDWMYSHNHPVVMDGTDRLLSQRMEREEAADKGTRSTTVLSIATGAVLLAGMVFLSGMFAGGSSSLTDVPSSPAAASVVMNKAVPQEQAVVVTVPSQPEEAIVQSPEQQQEEVPMDFLIDQSAGFFFY